MDYILSKVGIVVCVCVLGRGGGVLCGSHSIKFYNGALCDSVLTRTGQESRSQSFTLSAYT